MENSKIKELFNYWKINEQQILKLENYRKFLLQENIKFNLTAITSDEAIYYKHFYDSLLSTQNINLKNKKVMDIGTGAGFPGIIWKIFYDDIDLTLVESNSKKCLFLKELCEILNLNDVKILNERIEEVNKNEYENYDFVITRAVAKLAILLELSAQFLKINGQLISMKGVNWESEILQLNHAEAFVNLKFLKINKYKYEFNNELYTRADINYIKIGKTKTEYPRKYSAIKNKPLGS